MTRFGRELDRLREAETGSVSSIPDQLRYLLHPAVRPVPGARARADDDLPSGRVAATSEGRHYLIEGCRRDPHYHGRVRLGRFDPEDLDVLLETAGVGSGAYGRDRIVFLDTETTGLQGGTGMCPFLIGIGYYAGDSFEVRQYFIRDFDEEASMLTALGTFLERFDLIVTYNGRTFDLPLVENRCVLARTRMPFDHMAHLDLLYMARRLWRASHGSCRLAALEESIVGFARGPDIDGSRIPRAWFDYLRAGETRALGSVFSHNVDDILSLAALLIAAADRLAAEPAALEDPRDVYSLARVFDRGPDRSRSLRYYQKALGSALPADLRVRALERLSVLYRRAGEPERSFESCLALIGEPKFSLIGYEGAAIGYERVAKDPEAACRVLEEGISRTSGIRELRRRRSRLEARRNRLLRRIPAIASCGSR